MRKNVRNPPTKIPRRFWPRSPLNEKCVDHLSKGTEQLLCVSGGVRPPGDVCFHLWPILLAISAAFCCRRHGDANARTGISYESKRGNDSPTSIERQCDGAILHPYDHHALVCGREAHRNDRTAGN